LRVPWPLALVLLVAWGSLIWDLSSHRAPLVTSTSAYWELLSNLAHAPLFGILTLLTAALVLRERGDDWPRPSTARRALVLAVVLAYGLCDEWHQTHVPGRDGSLLDALTDLVSATLVLWIVATLARRDLTDRTLLARLGAGVL